MTGYIRVILIHKQPCLGNMARSIILNSLFLGMKASPPFSFLQLIQTPLLCPLIIHTCITDCCSSKSGWAFNGPDTSILSGTQEQALTQRLWKVSRLRVCCWLEVTEGLDWVWWSGFWSCRILLNSSLQPAGILRALKDRWGGKRLKTGGGSPRIVDHISPETDWKVVYVREILGYEWTVN